MNMGDCAFLCLDVGARGAKGMAVRVLGGQIAQSAITECESDDPAFAVKFVTDFLESQIGSRFDSAFACGGTVRPSFEIIEKRQTWKTEHKITKEDAARMISDVAASASENATHVIPLRYYTTMSRDAPTPVGCTAMDARGVFGVISYPQESIMDVMSALRAAHLECAGFFDASFLCAHAARQKKQTVMIVDMGYFNTTASIWNTRGPVAMVNISVGMRDAVKAVSEKTGLDMAESVRLMKSCLNAAPKDSDRFEIADVAYSLSRADISDAALPAIYGILENIRENLSDDIEKYSPELIMLCGGGSEIQSITSLFHEVFLCPAESLGSFGALRALASCIWSENSESAKKHRARRSKILSIAKLFYPGARKKRPKFVPILPSTLAFDMTDPATYSKFESAGISAIHCDIMDGFYVDRVFGGIESLKMIRSKTKAALHVHLMTEAPLAWAQSACEAGADCVLVSAGTSGVRAALKKIKSMGKKCGVALHPNQQPEILTKVLREIDEVLVMSMPKPGFGSTEFLPDTEYRISTLANTRKKYGLKFKISVDGGITPETAKKCWKAGADLLVSGTYLATAADFPLSVASLMNK